MQKMQNNYLLPEKVVLEFCRLVN